MSYRAVAVAAGPPETGFWRWTGFGSDATGGEQGQRIDFNE